MDIKIATPNKPINSDIFRAENPGKELYQSEDSFFISNVVDEAEANALIAAHNPPAPQEKSVTEKLALVGLSLDNLKVALGI